MHPCPGKPTRVHASPENDIMTYLDCSGADRCTQWTTCLLLVGSLDELPSGLLHKVSQTISSFLHSLVDISACHLQGFLIIYTCKNAI